VQEINIKLWRDDDAEDCSIEINGLRHEHVSAQEIRGLVGSIVFASEKSSTDEQQGALYKTRIVAELTSPPTNWVEVIRPESAIEHQLDKWVKQVAESNDELAIALHRLKASFELLLAGQKIPEANVVLAQVERALKVASMAKNVA
jgi:transposase-like protein